MCWSVAIPIIAGSALSGIGSAIKTRQATKQAQARTDARNAVLGNVMALNDPIAENSRARFDTRLAGSLTPGAEASAGSLRSGLLEGALDTPDTPMADSASPAYRSLIARAMLRVFDEGKQQAQALAKIGNYGDFWQNQGLANNDLARNLSVNANLASGNLALLPSLQDLAEVGATKPISPLGDIFIGIGNALGSAGGADAFTPRVA